MRRVVAAALLILFAAPSLGAQKKASVPKRPKLQPAADTNDAGAYYLLGQLSLQEDPKIAADAFYWTTRLNPYQADAYYARYAALLLADPTRIGRSIERNPKRPPPADVLQLDSLHARALMLDPFLYRKYEQMVLRRYFEHVVTRYSSYGSAPSGTVDRAYHLWVLGAGPEIRGWAAYCEGRFGEALKSYALAIKRAKDKAYLRAERGRIFYLTGHQDSALAEIALAIDDLRKRDTKELVVLYSSKAMLEHSVAKIHEQRGDADSARAAYGRALEEDLAFYPAHLNLGLLALQLGDTATATHELELAIEIRADEPMLRVFYGYLLSRLKRYADAETHLAKAIELEPYYARSYQLLGHVYEAQNKRDAAITQFEAYLARAALTDVPRPQIAERLASLRALARGSSQ